MVTYSLVVDKGGPRLKEHQGSGLPTMNNEAGTVKKTIEGTRTSMESFAITLSRMSERTVLNKTGLKGEYDFQLEWARDEAIDSGLPSLVTAIRQQMGLRLESERGPVELLVIDRIERPGAN